MARYIDADALLEELKSRKLIFEESTLVEEAIAEQCSVFEEAIEEAPTADVVSRSELAKEIFTELEKWLGDYDGLKVITEEKFLELKEKYTEGNDV